MLTQQQLLQVAQQQLKKARQQLQATQAELQARGEQLQEQVQKTTASQKQTADARCGSNEVVEAVLILLACPLLCKQLIAEEQKIMTLHCLAGCTARGVS